MKRKLGRFFARVSGVLRRVWRWLIPAADRTEVQLAPPRPDAPVPTVTREVVDLEFEEIRAALAAEPSVNASAPEAPRRPSPRPAEVQRFDEPGATKAVPIEVEPQATPPAEPPKVVADAEALNAPASADPRPADVSAGAEPVYKSPKYGREPRAKAKLAAPRPTPAAAPVPPKVEEPKPLVEPERPIEDAAVADLLARIDSFINMGELPTVAPESVIAVEPELLVEEPPVRKQIVEQLAAEQVPSPEVQPEAPAPTRPDPWEFIGSLRDGKPPELVSEPVALAEVLPEPVRPRRQRRWSSPRPRPWRRAALRCRSSRTHTSRRSLTPVSRRARPKHQRSSPASKP